MGHLKRLKFISVVVVLSGAIISKSFGLGPEEKEIIFRDEDYVYSEGPSCKSPNGWRGECVEISSCPILLGLIAKSDHQDILSKASCGWNKDIPMVCCDKSWNCTTPDNEPGHCIQLMSCPHIISLMKQQEVSQETVNYIRNTKYECGSNKFDICCTSLPFELASHVNEPATTSERILDDDDCKMYSMLSDQMLQCCGQNVGSNRIIGGEKAAIDEYPWTVAIEYVRVNVIKIKCGGTLISGRYVITAAHCLLIATWTPVNIRLGDYDIDNPGRDCVEIDGGGEDCADEAVVIPIAKSIVHPDYNSKSRNQANDIGLIKLQDSAPYTDFIRPICLPADDFTENPGYNILKATGWGASDEIQSYSPIKLHVDLPYVKRKECLDVYRRLNVSLEEGQMCAGGKKGKDTCKGDSGGALMLMKGHTTEIVGITSFGTIPCGLENRPAVYTKIYPYLPWIKSVMS